jgi:hypothetical protein
MVSPVRVATGWTLIVVSMLLACAVGRADVPTAEEDCRNRNSALCESFGVVSMVDGPCPATARTVRPSGAERCDQVATQVQQQSIPAPSSNATAKKSSRPRDDLARLGQIERWLLPTLVLAGGALAIGMVGWALRRLYLKRNSGDAVRRGGRSAIQVVAAFAIAVLVAWQAAGVAFQRMFSSFDNHDTAAPVLLAAPVAFAVFILVAVLAFAASAWILRILGNAIGKSR